MKLQVEGSILFFQIPVPLFKIEDLTSIVIALLLGVTIPIFTTHANRTAFIRGVISRKDISRGFSLQ